MVKKTGLRGNAGPFFCLDLIEYDEDICFSLNGWGVGNPRPSAPIEGYLMGQEQLLHWDWMTIIGGNKTRNDISGTHPADLP